jgi:hypothetical protein
MAGFGRSNSLSINTGGGLLYVFTLSLRCRRAHELTVLVGTMRTKLEGSRQASPRAAAAYSVPHSSHNKHSQARSSAA